MKKIFLLTLLIFVSGCVQTDAMVGRGPDFTITADPQKIFSGEETTIYVDIENNGKKTYERVFVDVFDIGMLEYAELSSSSASQPSSTSASQPSSTDECGTKYPGKKCTFDDDCKEGTGVGSLLGNGLYQYCEHAGTRMKCCIPKSGAEGENVMMECDTVCKQKGFNGGICSNYNNDDKYPAFTDVACCSDYTMKTFGCQFSDIIRFGYCNNLGNSIFEVKGTNIECARRSGTHCFCFKAEKHATQENVCYNWVALEESGKTNPFGTWISEIAECMKKYHEWRSGCSINIKTAEDYGGDHVSKVSQIALLENQCISPTANVLYGLENSITGLSLFSMATIKLNDHCILSGYYFDSDNYYYEIKCSYLLKRDSKQPIPVNLYYADSSHADKQFWIEAFPNLNWDDISVRASLSYDVINKRLYMFGNAAWVTDGGIVRFQFANGNIQDYYARMQYREGYPTGRVLMIDPATGKQMFGIIPIGQTENGKPVVAIETAGANVNYDGTNFNFRLNRGNVQMVASSSITGRATSTDIPQVTDTGQAIDMTTSVDSSTEGSSDAVYGKSCSSDTECIIKELDYCGRCESNQCAPKAGTKDAGQSCEMGCDCKEGLYCDGVCKEPSKWNLCKADKEYKPESRTLSYYYCTPEQCPYGTAVKQSLSKSQCESELSSKKDENSRISLRCFSAGDCYSLGSSGYKCPVCWNGVCFDSDGLQKEGDMCERTCQCTEGRCVISSTGTTTTTKGEYTTPFNLQKCTDACKNAGYDSLQAMCRKKGSSGKYNYPGHVTADNECTTEALKKGGTGSWGCFCDATGLTVTPASPQSSAGSDKDDWCRQQAQSAGKTNYNSYKCVDTSNDKNTPGKNSCVLNTGLGWCDEVIGSKCCIPASPQSSAQTSGSQQGVCQAAKPIEGKCTGGTPVEQCSGTKPYYCDKYAHSWERCDICGCPGDKQCLSDGSCGHANECNLPVDKMLPNGKEILECKLKAPAAEEILKPDVWTDVNVRLRYKDDLNAMLKIDMLSPEEYRRAEIKGTLEKQTPKFSFNNRDIQLDVELTDQLPLIARNKDVYIHFTIKNIGNGMVYPIKLYEDFAIDQLTELIDADSCNLNRVIVPDGKQFPRITCKLKIDTSVIYLRTHVVNINVNYAYELRKSVSLRIVK